MKCVICKYKRSQVGEPILTFALCYPAYIWSLHLPLHLGPFFFGTCSKNQNWNLLGFLQGIKYSKAWSVNSLTVWMYVVNAINVQIFVFVMLKPITYILLTSPDFTEENIAIFVSLILSWWIFFFFVVVFDNYNIYLPKKITHIMQFTCYYLIL